MVTLNWRYDNESNKWCVTRNFYGLAMVDHEYRSDRDLSYLFVTLDRRYSFMIKEVGDL